MMAIEKRVTKGISFSGELAESIQSYLDDNKEDNYSTLVRRALRAYKPLMKYSENRQLKTTGKT
jgi:hypothetical protein